MRLEQSLAVTRRVWKLCGEKEPELVPFGVGLIWLVKAEKIIANRPEAGQQLRFLLIVWSAPAERSGDGAVDFVPAKYPTKALSCDAHHGTPNYDTARFGQVSPLCVRG